MDLNPVYDRLASAMTTGKPRPWVMEHVYHGRISPTWLTEAEHTLLDDGWKPGTPTRPLASPERLAAHLAKRAAATAKREERAAAQRREQLIKRHHTPTHEGFPAWTWVRP